MTHKTAYLLGPLSSFAAPLAAWLIKKGWHVHIAIKPSLNLLSLSSLDLVSSARNYLEEALGGRNYFRTFQDRFKFVEAPESARQTKYDAVVFCGLPPNFDDTRVPRAPWAANELLRIRKTLKGVPVFLVSSLWGAVQKDRVVPEEIEFERRKPLSHWERICQNYETSLLKVLSKLESNWYFVRMPMLAGTTADGAPFRFTGPSSLFQELDLEQAIIRESASASKSSAEITIKLAYNPDSTLWFLPVDIAVDMFCRFIEDENRPRICNFVSTQATLNREWLHYLAKALGLKEIVSASKDSLNLPAILRKLLLDDIQVKTRNLFEVAGRYQLPPIKFDKKYFEKIVKTGRQRHWGRNKVATHSAPFSKELATYYFEQFIPSMLQGKLLRKATANNITVGFLFKDAENSGWTFRPSDGQITVEPYTAGGKKPRVTFSFSKETLARLIHHKMPFHKALLLREVEIEGPLLDAMKITQIIDQFLKDNYFNQEQLNLFQNPDLLS